MSQGNFISQEKENQRDPNYYQIFTNPNSDFLKSYKINLQKGKQKCIGQGNFGAVFKCKRKATQSEKKQVFAVKILKIGDEMQFQNCRDEALRSKKLDHESIIKCYDIFPKNIEQQSFKTCSEIAMVLEYAKFQNLNDYLNGGHLDEKEFRRLTRQLLLGIAHAHENQMIIYDLKPDNIMVTEDPVPPKLKYFKLADFGGALNIDPNSLKTSTIMVHSKQVNAIHYSELFAAPEFIRSRSLLEEEKKYNQTYKNREGFRAYKVSDEYSAFCVLLSAAGASYEQLERIHSNLKPAAINQQKQLIKTYEDLFQNCINSVISELKIVEMYGKTFETIILSLGKFNEKERKSAKELLEKFYIHLEDDKMKTNNFKNMSQKQKTQSMAFMRSSQMQFALQDIQKPQSYEQVEELNIRLKSGNYFFGEDTTNLLLKQAQKDQQEMPITFTGYEVTYMPLTKQLTWFYKGEFVDGVRQGKGQVFNEKQQLLFEGEFVNGIKNGLGKEFVIREKNGEEIEDLVYSGNYENGIKSGEDGIYIFASGAYYQGKFENDKPNGKGKFVPGTESITINNKQFDFPDVKMIYEGQFQNGKFNGRGELKDLETEELLFVGEFKNDLKHGPGVIYKKNQEQVTGTWVYGIKEEDYEKMKGYHTQIQSMNKDQLLQHIKSKLAAQNK